MSSDATHLLLVYGWTNSCPLDGLYGRLRTAKIATRHFRTAREPGEGKSDRLPPLPFDARRLLANSLARQLADEMSTTGWDDCAILATCQRDESALEAIVLGVQDACEELGGPYGSVVFFDASHPATREIFNSLIAERVELFEALDHLPVH